MKRAAWWVVLVLAASCWRPELLPAQTWRRALTGAAVGSLWVDYSQVRFGLSHQSPTWLFGYRFTPTSIAAVNGLEAAANVWAPRRWRPWVNAATVAFHVVSIRQMARRPIGVIQYPRGQGIMRIGVRLWP